MRIARAFPVAALLVSVSSLAAQDPQQNANRPRPQDTEVWEPVPAIVTPGPAYTVGAPSDAIVLFDGSDLDEWVSVRDKGPAAWKVERQASTGRTSRIRVRP